MLDALSSSSNISSSGHNVSEFKSVRTFVSRSSHDWIDQLVLKAEFTKCGLQEWLGVSGFEIKRDFERHQYNVTYTLPDSFEYDLDAEFSLEFRFSSVGPTHTMPQLNVSLSQFASFVVKSHTPQPLEDFFVRAQAVQDLITLGMGQPTPFWIDTVYFATPTTEGFEPWARAYFAMNLDGKMEPPHWADMMFNFPDVKLRFGSMVASWISNLSTFNSVISSILLPFALQECIPNIDC